MKRHPKHFFRFATVAIGIVLALSLSLVSCDDSSSSSGRGGSAQAGIPSTLVDTWVKYTDTIVTETKTYNGRQYLTGGLYTTFMTIGADKTMVETEDYYVPLVMVYDTTLEDYVRIGLDEMDAPTAIANFFAGHAKGATETSTISSVDDYGDGTYDINFPSGIDDIEYSWELKVIDSEVIQYQGAQYARQSAQPGVYRE